MNTLLYFKWITNKDLMYRTWNSALCYVAAWMGGGFGREWIHVYVWLRPQSVNPKGISPEYSLEGLMLKLKLQYFGHVM